MKMIITTTYTKLDQEWIDWWIKNNGPNYGVNSIADLPCSFESNDPTSPAQAKTTIETFDEL